MRRGFLSLLLTALSVGLLAQTGNLQTAKVEKPKAAVAKPKLTEQQKRGYSLLESAEDAAGGLQAPSRIVAYTQIARIYGLADNKKAIELLQQAYDSLRELELDLPDRNQNRQVKQQLERQLLIEYVALAPERVDKLMDQMDPELRVSALQGLLPYYEKQNNLDRAVSLLTQLAAQAEMPYGIANEVMTKLGSTHPEQVRELFLAALTSYQNHDHSDGLPNTDFPDLIAQASGKVPNESVETAIDEVLLQAKKADEKNSNVSVSLAFDKGAMQFKSMYDYQLFAVLPALEQVDPEKAKSLLKEREDVSTFAAKYPGGINLLSAHGRPFSIGINTGNSAQSPEASSHLAEEQRLNAIINDALKHPDDAMASAATLNARTALMAYLMIAHANSKKNTTVTAAALGKAQEVLPKAPLMEQVPAITEIAKLYELIGDKDSAGKVIDLGTKTADSMYKQETNADDPNLAPEAYWVTTNAWRNLVDESYKLDPAQATGLLKDAPDDAIRTFAQIALASRMVGSTAPSIDFSMSANKKGMMMTRSSSDDNQQLEKR